MAIYVVMEPPAADAAEAAERAVLVRDGFSVLAFLAPPLWLLWHRLWIEAALVVAASAALTALGEAAGLGFAGAALSLLISIYVGLEGQAMRIGRLGWRGWREWGVVEAGNAAEAELRYLAGEGTYEERSAVPHAVPIATGPAPVRLAPSALASGPALGLFDYPGRC